MGTLYVLALTFSAAFSVVIFMRLRQRLAPLFGVQDAPFGALISLSAIAFLVIVAAPAPILVSAIFLTFAGWRYDSRPFSFDAAFVLVGLTVALALSGLHVYPAVFSLPQWPFAILAGVYWLGLAMSASAVPPRLLDNALIFAVAMLPLAIAPLLSDAPQFLCLDIALIDAALLGAVLLMRDEPLASAGLTTPLALLLGFLQLRTLTPWGWPFALLSGFLWWGALWWKSPMRPRMAHAA